jgi:hypothetical protein
MSARPLWPPVALARSYAEIGRRAAANRCLLMQSDAVVTDPLFVRLDGPALSANDCPSNFYLQVRPTFLLSPDISLLAVLGNLAGKHRKTRWLCVEETSRCPDNLRNSL